MRMVESPITDGRCPAPLALGVALALWACALPAGAQAPASPVVAFLLKDAQGQLPWAAIAIERGGQAADPSAGLKACDVIKWVPGTASSVRIASVRGGRTWVLDASQPRLELPCEAAPRPWSSRMGRLWESVAGGPRESHVQAATSRGLEAQRPAPLHSTPFLAPRSFLTAGVRPLYLAWQGGQPPYAVTLRAPDGHVLAAQAGLSVPQWQTPRLTLKAGRHQLEVTDAQGESLRMTQLDVVAAQQLPPMPEGIQQLPIHEQRWLRAYVLEGWPGGEWGLEALQQLAPLRQRDPAVRDWLRESVAP